jgi:hypothetical protein
MKTLDISLRVWYAESMEFTEQKKKSVINLTIEELEAAIYGCSLVEGQFWYDQMVIARAKQKLLDQLNEALKRRSFNEIRAIEELIDERYSD